MTKSKGDDRHQSGFLIRFPEEFRAVFAALKEKLGQPYTEAARRAVLAYAKANGIGPPGKK